ncbi:hypothetical protein [Marinobacter xiaoshiensis]|uniref:Uncharacterized protein n=1 Tax=Marinobacter xiaoshiensis TaxID=3073652 RepID=A0ABU2HK68_9GAMM|nr:hypothetical protein [Marinobacter sp. F60267]MDS1311466.1 hypothetical protein [Marinobacter sp. F60267]
MPWASIEHVVGLRFHERILKAETPVFFRMLGVVLLAVSSVGMVSAFF